MNGFARRKSIPPVTRDGMTAVIIDAVCIYLREEAGSKSADKRRAGRSEDLNSDQDQSYDTCPQSRRADGDFDGVVHEA
jgi:hypothetical protein